MILDGVKLALMSARRLKHEFIKAIIKRYREADINIPIPIRTLDLPADTKIDLRK